MKFLVLLSAAAAVAFSQYVDDGQYHPNGDEGRYYPDGSGAYVHDDSGDYKGETYNSGSAPAYKSSVGAVVISNGARGYSNKGIASLVSGSSPASFAISGAPASFGAAASPASYAVVGSPAQYTSSQAYSSAPAPNSYNYYRILKQNQDVNEDGYYWEYETENRIDAQEQGKLYNRGTNAEALRATGSYSYVGPDNVLYTVRYTADENGFQAEGAHLPTPPPIPEAILRSLALQRARRTPKQ